MRNTVAFYLRLNNYEAEFVVDSVDHHREDGYSEFFNETQDRLEIIFPPEFYEKIHSIYSDPNVVNPDLMAFDMLRDYVRDKRVVLQVHGQPKVELTVGKMTINGR